MLQVSGTLSMVGGTMANATPRHGPTQVHSTASSCTSEKLTGVQDQHSTDRARQSTEDGQVRRLLLVSTESAGVTYFPFWPQTDHCFMQTNAWDYTEKCQEDLMLYL